MTMTVPLGTVKISLEKCANITYMQLLGAAVAESVCCVVTWRGSCVLYSTHDSTQAGRIPSIGIRADPHKLVEGVVVPSLSPNFPLKSAGAVVL